jgi:hypothetical protein
MIKNFYEEHLHIDEEIRWILDGEGFFDVIPPICPLSSPYAQSPFHPFLSLYYSYSIPSITVAPSTYFPFPRRVYPRLSPGSFYLEYSY